MFDKVVAAGADVTQEPREQSYCTDFAIVIRSARRCASAGIDH